MEGGNMQFTDSTFRPYATSVVGQQGSARSATACPDWDAARSFLALYWAEVAPTGRLSRRIEEVRAELAHYGTYRQTTDEIAYGAKLAWRNNTRCIGRLHWRSLEVRDLRHLASADEVFEACVEHIRLATNSGKIKPIISVFGPSQVGVVGPRIWNPQLIRYAGFRQSDGSILGDPRNEELTRAIQELGWKTNTEGPFTVLPLVIQMPGECPRVFELPQDAVQEVPIRHPNYDWFIDLKLKWHALPAVSDMGLEIGGVIYPAAPFNGWYMNTEIAARNLSDTHRYNVLPMIARRMGLEMRSDRGLWKDRAIVELNVALLHSFAESGVTMVDHHTAARQFITHIEREEREGRVTHAEWSWI
ncbi:MAG TPA: nitric oxide synthase oxygenase, partial [Chthoniobacterales bacterium]